MNIVALVSFYDETVGMLAEMVQSLADAGVSAVVAVDGAYAEYPAAQATTGVEQAATILEVASAHSMSASVYVPCGPWSGNELQKREFLFALGHQFVDIGEDWFWVIDADEMIVSRGDLYAALSTTDLDVAEVEIHEPGGSTWNLRMLFRSQPTGIRLGAYHAYYVTGDDRVLWASCHQKLQEPAVHVAGCSVVNRPLQRLPGRNRARREYAERAVLLGLDQAMI